MSHDLFYQLNALARRRILKMRSLIKLTISLLLSLGLFGPGGFVFSQPVTWKIDPEHFSIVFEADHIGYQSQLGLFLEGSGEFDFDPKTFEFFFGASGDSSGKRIF